MEQGHVGRRCGTDPAGLAALLLEAFEAAKFEGGTAAGFAGGQAGSDVVRDLLLEVELRLGVEAPFGQAFCQRRRNQRIGQPLYSAVRRIKATASERRSQFETSVSSC